MLCKMPKIRVCWVLTEEQQPHKENNRACVEYAARGENTNLSSRCRWGPARCSCPWWSPGWRCPLWPLSLLAYSSVRPRLLASWHVWSPCSGPRPDSERRTNNRFDLTQGTATRARIRWNMKTRGTQTESMKQVNIISRGHWCVL